MKKLSGSFRNTQWDPSLIISQIISVQCLIYFSLCLIIAILNSIIIGDSNSLQHIFEYHVSTYDNLRRHFNCPSNRICDKSSYLHWRRMSCGAPFPILNWILCPLNTLALSNKLRAWSLLVFNFESPEEISFIYTDIFTTVTDICFSVI